VKIMATTQAAAEPDIQPGTQEQLSPAELDDIVGGAATSTICCPCTN
jgi:hypothetical protein